MLGSTGLNVTVGVQFGSEMEPHNGDSVGVSVLVGVQLWSELEPHTGDLVGVG